MNVGKMQEYVATGIAQPHGGAFPWPATRCTAPQASRATPATHRPASSHVAARSSSTRAHRGWIKDPRPRLAPKHLGRSTRANTAQQRSHRPSPRRALQGHPPLRSHRAAAICRRRRQCDASRRAPLRGAPRLPSRACRLRNLGSCKNLAPSATAGSRLLLAPPDRRRQVSTAGTTCVTLRRRTSRLRPHRALRLLSRVPRLALARNPARLWPSRCQRLRPHTHSPLT